MMAGHYRLQISGPGRPAPVVLPGRDKPAFEASGIRIWSDVPVIPVGEFGCIIGHLFSRTNPGCRVTMLDDDAARAAQTTNGRSLLRDFWGGYVAVLSGSEGAVNVLRDPSALLPCYYRSDGDGFILSSDLGDLADRGRGAADFAEIGRLLTSVDMLGRKTCLSGVTELLAGECMTCSSTGSAISVYWSPWHWTTPDRPIAFEPASARLKKVIHDCVGSWAACFGSILLGVSGGLDSSIVACASHPRASMLHCLNLVSSGPGGDETRYAAILASALGLPLDQRLYDLSAIDIGQPVAPHHPWPNAPYFMQAIAAEHSRFRSTHQIDAHFSGNGGDNVFCSLHTAAPFVDRFLTQGSRSGLMTTLRDLALLTGADGMTILRHAWGIYRQIGTPLRVRCDTSGLSEAFVDSIQPFAPQHPWLDVPDGALPGKISHVKQLIRAHRGVELYPRRSHPVHIAPLMSQPVVELCLAIPTWHWIHGGINRAVAREAVRGLIPEAVRMRTSKGGPTGFMREVFHAHGRKAEELLHDGLLAKAGILDLSIFTGAGNLTAKGSDKARRILTLCAAESWARWWS